MKAQPSCGVLGRACGSRTSRIIIASAAGIASVALIIALAVVFRPKSSSAPGPGPPAHAPQPTTPVSQAFVHLNDNLMVSVLAHVGRLSNAYFEVSPLNKVRTSDSSTSRCNLGMCSCQSTQFERACKSLFLVGVNANDFLEMAQVLPADYRTVGESSPEHTNGVLMQSC